MRGWPSDEAVLGAVALDQPALDDPVDLAVDQAQVVGLDGLEPALPQVERPLDRWGGDPRRSTKSRALPRYSAWISSAVASRPLARRTLRRAGGVAADLADRADRVLHA